MLKQMQKNPAFLWIFLCLAVFLSCLPRQSLNPSEQYMTKGSLSSLQESSARRSDWYPDRILGAMTKGQSSLFLSRLTTAHRIPLRLPVPHLWISFFFCLIAGLQLLFQHQANRLYQTEHTGNYIIRYIHDQNGETYRSFLF